MSFLGIKKFNVGDVVTEGIKLLAEKEKLLTDPSYLKGLNSSINESVASLCDLGKNLGAIFHKPYGASLLPVKPAPKNYTFENDYPVIYGGYGVTINGKELGAERLAFITNLTINQNIGTDTCDFTVSDPNFYFIEDNIYKRDSPIQTSITLLGTSEINNFTKIAFNGFISIVDINFPNDGAPTLQISCVDKATHLMTRKKWRRSWENVTSAQVVEIIAKEMGFKCYVEPDYPFPVQASIVQDNKTNMEFLEELAGKELDLFVVNPITNADGSTIIYYIIKGHLNDQFYYSLGYKTSSGKDENVSDMDKVQYDIISFTPRINIETRQEEEKQEAIDKDSKNIDSYDSGIIEDDVFENGGSEDDGWNNGNDKVSSPINDDVTVEGR